MQAAGQLMTRSLDETEPSPTTVTVTSYLAGTLRLMAPFWVPMGLADFSPGRGLGAEAVGAKRLAGHWIERRRRTCRTRSGGPRAWSSLPPSWAALLALPAVSAYIADHALHQVPGGFDMGFIDR